MTAADTNTETNATISARKTDEESWTDNLSLDAFSSAAQDFLRDQGGPLVDTISRKARANPVAFAAAGLSAAWLIYGTASKMASNSEPEYRSEFERRVRAAEDGSSDTGWKATAADLRDKLADGTESLSETAKERVIAARKAAVDAQHQVEQSASYYARRASETMRSQPMLAGALAAAAGSVLAAMLPGSDQEDRLFGAQRDDLLREADRVYRDELAKLKRV